MKEHIEREALIAQAKEDLPAYGMFGELWAKQDVIEFIEDAPAADVVERKRGEWVSVEERLPDIELVEAKANDLEYFPCLAVIKSTVSVLRRYVGKLWYGEEGFIDQDFCPMDDVVTHWMPLPELPNCGADMRNTEVEDV